MKRLIIALGLILIATTGWGYTDPQTAPYPSKFQTKDFIATGNADVTGIMSSKSPYSGINNGEYQRRMDVLPLDRDWTACSAAAGTCDAHTPGLDIADSRVTDIQQYMVEINDIYYFMWEWSNLVYYSTSGAHYDLKIGVATTTDLSGTWSIADADYALMAASSLESGAPSGTGTTSTLVDTGAFTGDVYAGNWVFIYDTSLAKWQARIIASHTDDTLTLSGDVLDAATVSSDTYEIRDVNAPDSWGVADPVMLHIPSSDQPYQMWFDMKKANATEISTGAAKWNIGHGYCASGCGAASGWTKQDMWTNAATATGIATSGYNTTLTDTTASWSDMSDEWLIITRGKGAGQKRRIGSNTATVITLSTVVADNSKNWGDVPDDTSYYEVRDFTADGYTDKVIKNYADPKFFGLMGGYGGHSPEAFICGGTTYLISNTNNDYGGGHRIGYDPMLWIANDNQGIGYSFYPYGFVGLDVITSMQNADRMQSFIVRGNTVHATLQDERNDGGSADAAVYVVSTDCGRSWQQYGVSNATDKSDGAAFYAEDNRIYRINREDDYFDYIDLTSLSGTPETVATVEPFATVPLPSQINTQQSYMVNGVPVAAYSNLWVQGNSIFSDKETIDTPIKYSSLQKLSPEYTFNNRPVITFDGAADYLNGDDSGGAFNAVDIGTSDFGVEFWIKTTATTASVIGKGNSSLGATGDWGIFLSSTFYWKLTDGTTTSRQLNFGADAYNAIADNEWHHVLLILDYSNGNLNLYIDGALDNSSGTSAGVPSGTTEGTADFEIATRGSGTAMFAGSMANVRIYKAADLSAISATEALYNYRFPGGVHPNLIDALVPIYDLNDGNNVSTINDTSANNLDLTIVGSPSWSRPPLN